MRMDPPLTVTSRSGTVKSSSTMTLKMRTATGNSEISDDAPGIFCCSLPSPDIQPDNQCSVCYQAFSKHADGQLCLGTVAPTVPRPGSSSSGRVSTPGAVTNTFPSYVSEVPVNNEVSLQQDLLLAGLTDFELPGL